MRKLRILILVLLVLWLVGRSDRFLVVDQPQKADVIVVLAGETDKRPARGLELLREGLASKLVLDVPGDARVYDTTYVELAQRWAGSSRRALRLWSARFTDCRRRPKPSSPLHVPEASGPIRSCW